MIEPISLNLGLTVARDHRSSTWKSTITVFSGHKINRKTMKTFPGLKELKNLKPAFFRIFDSFVGKRE